jgi:hypothetical protein
VKQSAQAPTTKRVESIRDYSLQATPADQRPAAQTYLDDLITIYSRLALIVDKIIDAAARNHT